MRSTESRRRCSSHAEAIVSGSSLWLPSSRRGEQNSWTELYLSSIGALLVLTSRAVPCLPRSPHHSISSESCPRIVPDPTQHSAPNLSFRGQSKQPLMMHSPSAWKFCVSYLSCYSRALPVLRCYTCVLVTHFAPFACEPLFVTHASSRLLLCPILLRCLLLFVCFLSASYSLLTSCPLLASCFLLPTCLLLLSSPPPAACPPPALTSSLTC